MTKPYTRLDKTQAAVLLVDHQAGLLSLVRSKNHDILEDVRKTNDLSGDTEKKLKGVVDGYAKTFA